VFSRSEERGKTSARIEVRKTEPIDRTLFRDQGRRMAIADHRVIFNWYGQGLPPQIVIGCTEPGFRNLDIAKRAASSQALCD
jgi:hypothetical protein